MSQKELIAVYGKGGIGKSVVATGISTSFARKDSSVLHVGCDPKRDSSLRLLGHMPPTTVVDLLGMESTALTVRRLINTGRHGIQCIESGGPKPGLGCGGRGVARTIEIIEEFEIIENGDFDVVVFDVLGDVVCGGFAAPLRQGFANKIVIVISEEPMAMFAANNIAKAIVTYQRNGVGLAGLVVNLRSSDSTQQHQSLIHSFAKKMNTRILVKIPRDQMVIEAEKQCKTVLDVAPESLSACALEKLTHEIKKIEIQSVELPTPLSDEEFFQLIK